jgi:hypothetical protein
MKARVCLLAAFLVLALGVAPQVWADASVFVGYADGLRPSAFFPTPWSGSTGVTFIGDATGDDAGAIRIDNTGLGSIVITDVSVNINGTNLGDIWGLGGSPVTLAPGGILILTQNSGFNFDTSDVHPITSNTNPCLGLVTDPPVCSTHPVVSITFQGVGTSTFGDTGHVLDTGGFDFVNALVCPNPLEFSGNCNESLQWRPIGTTGIGNPGGVTPEPASLILLGTGIAGLVMRRRKQA